MDPRSPASARITWRSLAGIESELAPVGALEILRSGEVAPWRQFCWHRGQAHYSGLYWSATTGGHVVYESRLELARMLLADFAPPVGWIVAQPFLVEAVVAGQPRRHVPDVALIDRAGAITIVNVKLPDRIGDPKVAATFAWAGRVFGDRGWQHEVWTGALEVLLDDRMGTWQRRWTLWMLGAAAAMTALLGCGVVVLYNLPGMQEPSFGTDKALLGQTKARLAEVVAEFNALPLPEGVMGKDAKYFGCGTESGGLYQPFVLRELTVPPLAAVPAAAAVAQALRERGWTASPDGSHGYKLAGDRGDWSLMGWVAASSASNVVWVQARTDGAEPCRLDSE